MERIANTYVKVIGSVNLELSVPPVEHCNIRVEILNSNCTHSRKFSVRLIKCSERFERDTN